MTVAQYVGQARQSQTQRARNMKATRRVSVEARNIKARRRVSAEGAEYESHATC